MTQFQGGTFESQKNDPVSKLIGSNQYRDIPKGVIDDYFSGRKSQEETISAITGTPLYDASKGPQMDMTGKGNVPYDKNLMEVQAGVNDAAAKLGGMQGTMTKEHLQAQLDHGHDPANLYTPEKSAGSKIGASFGSPASGTGAQGGSAPLPYPNVGAMPTPPGGGDEMTLDQKYGLDAAQSQVGIIDQQIADIQTKLQAELGDIMTTPGVSTRYMSREAKMAHAGISNQLAELRAQRSVLTRQLTQGTRAVGMIMRARSLDFANAERQYQFEVSQNEKAQSLFDRKEARSEAQTQRAEDKQLSREKAQLTVMMNHIDPTKPMTKDEQAVYDRLGMEVYGFDWASIRDMMHPKETVYHSIDTDPLTGAKTFTTVTRESGGGVSVQSTPIGTKNVAVAAESHILQALGNAAGSDGFVDPKDYEKAKRDWVQRTGKSGSEFDNKASIYRNPNQPKGTTYNLNPVGAGAATF